MTKHTDAEIDAMLIEMWGWFNEYASSAEKMEDGRWRVCASDDDVLSGFIMPGTGDTFQDAVCDAWQLWGHMTAELPA